MDPYQQFRKEVSAEIEAMADDAALKASSADWFDRTFGHRYPYHFECLGRPIIQYPQDIVAIQEIIWNVNPSLVIETGIAHGGSLILSASMLAQLDMCEAITAGSTFDPRSSRRRVFGIDIDIRPHNRQAIEAHPLSVYIEMIEGSSIDPQIVAEVKDMAAGHDRILVCLDSMHTHDHVLGELEAYAPLVSEGSYCCVFDTVIEDMPRGSFPDRPWEVGNNPKTAVHEWLERNSHFVIDKDIHRKLLVTVAPDGFLKRIR